MIPLNFYADLGSNVSHVRTRRSLYVLRAIDARAQLFTAETLLEDSFDRYLTLRESYLQNRLFLIFDGNPPEDEDFYDEFYEDFEDDYEEEEQDPPE